jgi:hypothetical protein
MINIKDYNEFRNNFITFFETKKFITDIVDDKNVIFKSKYDSSLYLNYNIKRLYSFLKNIQNIKEKTIINDLFELDKKKLLKDTCLDENEINILLSRQKLTNEIKDKKLNILFIARDKKIIKKFDYYFTFNHNEVKKLDSIELRFTIRQIQDSMINRLEKDINSSSINQNYVDIYHGTVARGIPLHFGKWYKNFPICVQKYVWNNKNLKCLINNYNGPVYFFKLERLAPKLLIKSYKEDIKKYNLLFLSNDFLQYNVVDGTGLFILLIFLNTNHNKYITKFSLDYDEYTQINIHLFRNMIILNIMVYLKLISVIE